MRLEVPIKCQGLAEKINKLQDSFVWLAVHLKCYLELWLSCWGKKVECFLPNCFS